MINNARSAPIDVQNQQISTSSLVPLGRAYITNYLSNNVYVVDLSSNTIIKTIVVGSGPQGVAISSGGSKVFVSNSNSDSVSAIDAANGIVTATIPVGSRPFGIAVTPDGTQVFVACFDTNSVSVISAQTNTVTAKIAVGAQPSGLAISPDGTRVYVATANSNSVTVFNPATPQVITTAPVGQHPYGIAVSPDGKTIFVANEIGNSVSVLSAATLAVVATIQIGQSGTTSLYGIAATPDGSKVVVASQDGFATVISTATNSILAKLNLGGALNGVSISLDSATAYVVNGSRNAVFAIDLSRYVFSSAFGTGITPVAFGSFIGPVPSIIPTQGWWWDPTLSNQGFAIGTNGSPGDLFVSWFGYDQTGSASWLYSVASQGPANTYSGTFGACAGGQPFASTVPRAASCASSGLTTNITFSSANSAQMTLSNGRVFNLVPFNTY